LVCSLKYLHESFPLRVAEVIGPALLLRRHDFGHRGLPDCPHNLLKLRPVFTSWYVETSQQCRFVLLVCIVAISGILKLTTILLELNISLGPLLIIVHLILIVKIFLSADSITSLVDLFRT